MITPHAYFKFTYRGVSSGIIAFDECEYIDKLIVVYDFKIIGVIEVVHPFMYLTITEHFRTNVVSQMLMTWIELNKKLSMNKLLLSSNVMRIPTLLTLKIMRDLA